MKLFRRVTLLIALLVLAFAAIARSDEPSVHPIMHPDQATLDQWVARYQAAPQISASPRLAASLASSIDLTSYLAWNSSNMSERDQACCGNCWVWSGTGVMEVALYAQNGIKDRLSEQFLNSCRTSSDACDGGWLSNLVDFYNSEGYAIPWSNSGASWQESVVSGSYCTGTRPTCASISASPKYPISSVSLSTISTQSVSDSTAISNIKSVLNEGKGVWFGFFMPTAANWTSFYNFWDYQAESVVWTPPDFSGQTWTSGGGGHAVLCVGYDDATNSWLMLNSWGTTGSRPNGLFRVSMGDLDYSATYVYGGHSYYAFHFQTLNVTFSTSNHAPTLPSDPSPANGSTGVSLPPTLSWTGGDSDNDTVTYRVVLDTSSSPTTQVCNETATTCSPGTLAEGTDYYWRVYATDEHGSGTTGPIWHFRTLDARNDDFAEAIVVSQPLYLNAEDTTGATIASDDPSVTLGTCGTYFSGRGSHSVWYQYTPSANRTITITTVNSDYDTVLAVWTGTRGALSLASCGDDVSATTLQSRTSLLVSAGTTYHIEVMDYDVPGSGGTLQFAMRPETNNHEYLPIIMKEH